MVKSRAPSPNVKGRAWNGWTAKIYRVDAKDWLDELGGRVVVQLAETDVYRAGLDTLSLAVGTRIVTAHVAGDVVWLSPSFAAGRTIASRLQDRVQHLDIEQYMITEATIDVAVDAVVAHLKPTRSA